MNLIRKFEPPDFPSVIDIERKVFNEHDPFFYMQFYETCSEGFLVAEVNGIVVGFVVGFLASEDTGRIFSLAVLPAYRNRGIGSALMSGIVKVLRQMGVAEIVLEVRESNMKAIRFYQRHGFYRTGTLDRYYNNGENGTVMKLRISPAEV